MLGPPQDVLNRLTGISLHSFLQIGPVVFNNWSKTIIIIESKPASRIALRNTIGLPPPSQKHLTEKGYVSSMCATELCT